MPTSWQTGMQHALLHSPCLDETANTQIFSSRSPRSAWPEVIAARISICLQLMRNGRLQGTCQGKALGKRLYHSHRRCRLISHHL